MPLPPDNQASSGLVVLREATAEDAFLAFEWRNDPRVRSQAHDSGALTFSGHTDWWNASVTDPARHLLIAVEGGSPVGVLRLDLTGSSAVVSIYLDPAQTGRGLGRQTLLAGEDYARELGLQTLIASIKQTNAPSKSAFSGAGYDRSGDFWVRKLHPPAA
ncbi:GNAT family N-acetyltransferase [Brevundimonas sp. FT23042]|uniref:GNAT family N-acetyltransferase n=1 Tax=Brevundimonas sp. FT23042 TaxID=3393749 RepID=UPI003B588543